MAPLTRKRAAAQNHSERQTKTVKLPAQKDASRNITDGSPASVPTTKKPYDGLADDSGVLNHEGANIDEQDHSQGDEDTSAKKSLENEAVEDSAGNGTSSSKQSLRGNPKKPKIYPCPLATKLNCDKKFTSVGNAGTHARAVHRMQEEKKFPCPRGCGEYFVTAQGAGSHAFHHDREPKPKSQPSDKAVAKHPCPYGCGKEFDRETGVNRHVKQAHVEFDEPIRCFAEHEGCQEEFTDQTKMNAHLSTCHPNQRWPCFYLTAPSQCTERFVDRETRKQHMRDEHGGLWPCPVGKMFNCHETFSQSSNSIRHGETHRNDRKRYSCSFPGCDKTYAAAEFAARHYDSAHNGKLYECPTKNTTGCVQKFTDKASATFHARNIHCKSWACQVPMCVRAVAKKLYSRSGIESHIAKHISRGHCTDPEHREPLLLATSDQQHLLSIIDRIKRLTSVQLKDGTDQIVDEHADDGANTNEEDEAEDGLIFPQPGDPTNEQEKVNTMAHNDMIIEKYPELIVTFGNAGLTCVGPTFPNAEGFVRNTCPYKTIISYETAFMIRKDGYVRLIPRCVACHVQQHLSQFFGEDVAPMPGQTQCAGTSCEHALYQGTKFCIFHLLQQSRVSQPSQEKLSAMRECLLKSRGKQWSGTNFQKVSKALKEGHKVIILDNEFSPSTFKIFETRVFDYETGVEIINARVQYDEDKDLHRSIARPVHPFLEKMSETIHKRIFNSDRARESKPLGVHEIASKLANAGVNQNSIFIAWHLGAKDLELLRTFVEEEGGYKNLLPPDDNCIPMIPEFRKNVGLLADGSRCSLKLEFIFPALFPKHELVGKNHEAAVDCKQLRMMCHWFDEACLPLDKQPEHMVKYKEQKTLSRWVQRSPKKKDRNGVQAEIEQGV